MNYKSSLEKFIKHPDSINPDKEIKKSGNINPKLEQEYYKERYRLENNSIDQDIKQRKKYAQRIFLLITGWIITICFFVFLQGLNYICIPFFKENYLEFGFQLSDSVLITLITTTTANVAAYFLVVTKYLFPTNGGDNKKKKVKKIKR